MADIHIQRKHKLGLGKAREVAWQWAEEVEKTFDMECSVLEGETSDRVEFTRSGVKGCLIVTGEQFELSAKLGILLGAFSRTIESEIERNLDALLAGTAKASPKAAAEKGTGKPVGKAVGKAAATKTAAAKPATKKKSG